MNFYNRRLAAAYAEEYSEIPNLGAYPYYNGNDCTNFVSQALKAGGMYEEQGRWDSFKYWFCNTKKNGELEKVSLTWRTARYFHEYWGSHNVSGRKRAYGYEKIPLKYAVLDFKKIYETLDIGDVVQYSNLAHDNYPYHTQMIYKKTDFDFLMAQHTENRKDVSLYEYLNIIRDNPGSFIYIYVIA